jgi:hypothetical protein
MEMAVLEDQAEGEEGVAVLAVRTKTPVNLYHAESEIVETVK